MDILWLILGIATAFFVAWNNGSNNAPNSIGTAVGAGVISVRKALIIASIASFAGSMSLGIYVTNTVMRGIVNTVALQGILVVRGMIAVLIATGFWTLASTFLKVPMSVHVCIIGGIIGFGLAVGSSFISWSTVIKILLAWAIVPVAAVAIAVGLYHVFHRSFRDPSVARLSVIAASYITVATPIVLLLLKTATVADIATMIIMSFAISSLATLVIYKYWQRMVRGGHDPVHEASKILLIMAALSMAYSFGSNDVANSAGPLAAILYALGIDHSSTPVWLALIVAALGLSLGIAIWGEKIIGTIGEKITPLSPLTAYVAQMSATLTMLVVSRLGLPVSTSMAIVGGVMGVGVARGLKNVNLKLIARIFGVWLIALPITIFTGYFLTLLFINYIP